MTGAMDAVSDRDRRFSAVYREFFPLVFRFGYRLLGDSEAAMELTQEVFAKLFAALDGGPAIREVKSWLFRSAANLGYDWLRRERRLSKLLPSALAASRAPADVEEDFARAEERKALRTALERLPPRDRILLTLYAEGLPYKGIAAATGMREASIGKFIARATQRLAAEFNEGNRI